jgi:RNA polymerase sigma-70 factor (ECF subfamily)
MAVERTDEQLLQDFQRGRQSALGELARRHERALLGLAAGVLGGQRDLACDAVQEAWVRVIRFAGQFNGRSAVKTWLYRIVINQCHTLAGARNGATLPPDTLAQLAPGPAAAAEHADFGAAVRDAVAQLDPDRRTVVLLCYHGGLTHEQAAEILEIPLGTLKSRLHAALTDLRARLAAEATS